MLMTLINEVWCSHRDEHLLTWMIGVANVGMDSPVKHQTTSALFVPGPAWRAWHLQFMGV